MNSRKKRLINPGLQLRLVAIFLCTAALAVQAEAILITYTMTRLASQMPNDSTLLLAELPEYVRTNLLLTFAILAPLTLGVGIVATFRIAGPLYRFELFLRAVKDGKQVEPCAIRKGDELQSFCDLLNEVTSPLRERASVAVKAERASLESVAPAIPASAEAAPEPSPAGPSPRRSPSDYAA